MNDKYYSENDIILLGAGGHAKVIIDTIQNFHKQLNIIGITDYDSDKIGKSILNIPILGTDDVLENLYKRGLKKAFITLGMVKDSVIRKKLYSLLKEIGFEIINIIHGTSILSTRIEIGEGNAILSGTIINIGTKIGSNCIINTGSIIEHDCIIGDNVHVAPGVKISGGVNVGDNCMIGVGTSIIQGVSIGMNSVVGAGSVVVKDIEADSIAVGIPAKVIKKR